MTLDQYIVLAKKELDDFATTYRVGRETAEDKKAWPLLMDEGDWAEQELATRFGMLP